MTDMKGIALVLAVLVLGGVVLMTYVAPPATQGGGGGGVTPPAAVICPSTSGTSTTIDASNVLDTSGTGAVDVGMVCIGANGAVRVLSDTTGNAQTVACNVEESCKMLSNGNAGGDQGKLVSILSGTATMAADGSGFTFTPTGYDSYVKIGVQTQGALEVRAFNADDKKWACVNASECGTWQTASGVIFGDSATGAAIAMDAGDELNLQLEYRADASYENVNDRGVVVAVDAGAGVWKEPSIIVNGVTYTSNKAALTPEEQVAYSDSEYAIIVPQDVLITSNNKLTVDFGIVADTAPGAGDDVTISVQPRGTYQKTTDTNQVVGASCNKDDSGKTSIHEKFTVVANVA